MKSGKGSGLFQLELYTVVKSRTSSGSSSDLQLASLMARLWVFSSFFCFRVMVFRSCEPRSEQYVSKLLPSDSTYQFSYWKNGYVLKPALCSTPETNCTSGISDFINLKSIRCQRGRSDVM